MTMARKVLVVFNRDDDPESDDEGVSGMLNCIFLQRNRSAH